MEQVGSSASDDQCPLTTTPRNPPWEQGRLTSESAVPPPTPRAVPAGQAPNQQAQAQTDGYGTGGGNGWLTRSVNLLEERGDRVMLAVCALLAVAGGVVAVHEGSTLKFADESQYTAIRGPDIDVA